MKNLALLLIVFILCQGCVVYQPTAVPLSEAHDKGRVKVITNSGDEIRYKNIELEDGIFYVVHKERIKNDVKGYEWVEKRTILNSDTISSVYLKDYKKSKNKTVLLVAVGIPGAFLLYVGIFILVFAIAGNGF